MAFVTNWRGTTHSVHEDVLRSLIESGRYRLATNEEIRRWYESQGLNSPESREVDNVGKSKYGATHQSDKKPHR